MGTFLEAEPLDRARGPLYMQQPAGGTPGVEPGTLLELISPVYGLCVMLPRDGG